MILNLADWKFDVDVEKTQIHTTQNSTDHCECDYCKNYYEAVDVACPRLRSFLSQFGINIAGPSELMPFEPTLMLACYRVQGSIIQWGNTQLFVDSIPVTAETSENGTFLLWVGEMELPWLQNINVEDVVSPANLPEFLARMQEVWYLRYGSELFYS